MNASPDAPKRPPNFTILLVVAGFILGIGAGYVSTLFSHSLPNSSAVSLQSPTPTTTSTAVPPTPTLFLPTFPPGLPPEEDSNSTTPQATLTPVLVEGKAAPNFTLKAMDGKEVSLADFTGKPVLINIWATWCPPCRDEMAAIQAAYDKYSSKGLVVLAINFTVQDTRPDVEAFVSGLKLTFPILMDETGEVSSRQFGVHALPMSFFIDTQGIIQRTVFGAMLPAELEEYIAAIFPQ
jgi:peroxiredoxin